MADFTVVGGAGFVGSALVRQLENEGHSCRAPARGEDLGVRIPGHVIYCAGFTGDWSQRPYDAVDAHVGGITQLARTAAFDSLLYLSSTRVYDRHPGSLAHEDDAVVLRPQIPGDLYALSKAAGEAVTLAAGGRVARVSSVYGPGLERHAFLPVLLRDAVERGRVILKSSYESARDFISVNDVVALLLQIALEGTERVYNVASGVLVTNLELAEAISRLTGCEVDVRKDAVSEPRPAIDISRVSQEFEFTPARLLDDLRWLLGTVRA